MLWRKCHTCSRSLFFTAAHCHLALVAAGISHFVTTATQNFHVVLQTKKCPLLFFISRSVPVALFLVELCWPATHFLFFSVFLLLYIPNLWT